MAGTLESNLVSVLQSIGADVKTILARLLPTGGTAGQVLTKNSAADYDAFWVTPSSGGGGGVVGVHAYEPLHTPGGYISCAVNGTIMSTLVGANNRIDFYPFIPVKDVRIDELAVEVGTAVASTSIRVGIYSSVSGQPGALLTGQGSLLGTSAVGAKASAITPITLTAGTTYWVAIHTNGAPNVRAMTVNSMLNIGAAASGTGVYTIRRGTSAFASGLPTTAPAAALTSAAGMWVRMRIGA